MPKAPNDRPKIEVSPLSQQAAPRASKETADAVNAAISFFRRYSRHIQERNVDPRFIWFLGEETVVTNKLKRPDAPPRLSTISDPLMINSEEEGDVDDDDIEDEAAAKRRRRKRRKAQLPLSSLENHNREACKLQILDVVSATGSYLTWPTISMKTKSRQGAEVITEDYESFQVTEDPFKLWLEKIYIPETNPAPGQERLLILCHKNLILAESAKDIADLCEKSKISLMFLPADNTDRFQRLDICAFATMKPPFEIESGVKWTAEQLKLVPTEMFCNWYQDARDVAIAERFTPPIWMNFGLYPPDETKFMRSILCESIVRAFDIYQAKKRIKEEAQLTKLNAMK
ncbi:uncharacterized protein LODBEIA_P56410 [Lodderomyces beijingensis]|uniref:DDE-1 domain-containing protein n=1 Tax=Lodderomyces beijingensis TaxID=1775926 RepID=A0ABP0ZWF2_9ASCO